MPMPGMMPNPAVVGASPGTGMPNMMGQPAPFGPMVPNNFGNEF